MSKCPNCKKEIVQLRFERDVRQRGIIKIDKDGDLEYLIDQPDDEITSDYFCPLCASVIEIDPEEFLKVDSDCIVYPVKYNLPIIKDFNFRYYGTLRIYFNFPIGIGSSGDFIGYKTEEEFDLLFKKFTPQFTIKTLLKYNKLEKEINEIIKNSLKKYKCDNLTLNRDIELDWRDDLELEIHNIDQNKFDDSVIQEINSKLKELLGE